MSYIDTSVLVAYYCPEPISTKAEKAILKADLPTVSHLAEIEFASAIARKVREKLLSRSRQMIGACDCRRGCPACVGPILASDEARGFSPRESALRVLALLEDGS